MWEYQLRLLRVIDGDTIDASIDLGFHTHRNIRIRLYGIDTPEIRTRDAREKRRGFLAKGRLWDMLTEAEQIIVKSHGVGKFGRCLGQLFVVDKDGKRIDVSATLIEEGHGKEYSGGKR